MKYYFPIEIEGRKMHVCCLEENKSEKDLPHSFIVKKDGAGSRTLLFTIFKDTKLLSENGTDADVPIDLNRLQVDELGDAIHIELNGFAAAATPTPEKPRGGMGMGFGKTPPPVVTAEATPTIKHETTNGATRKLAVVLRDNGNVDFLLERRDEDKRTTNQLVFRFGFGNQKSVFTLCLAPKSHTFDLILDFGSEASQMKVRDMTMNNNTISNVNCKAFARPFYPANYPLDDSQQLKEMGLVRSIFYVKKDDSNLALLAPPSNDALECVKFITIPAEELQFTKNHFILSNMKLAEFGTWGQIVLRPNGDKTGIQFDKLSNTIYHKLLFNFFHIGFKSQEAIKKDPKEGAKYFHLHLLVPNVFSQNKICSLQQMLRENMEKFCEEFPNYNIGSWEVTIHSESDASFMGYVSQRSATESQKLPPNKKFLVVDMGKGTTDFSILQTDSVANSYLSLYRSGFIGAGNVLTFAFIDTMLTTALDPNGEDEPTPEERKKLMYRLIYSKDVEELWRLRFMNLVERLKIEYGKNTNSKRVKKFTPDLGTAQRGFINLETLCNKLETFMNEGNILDDTHLLIEKSCKQLVNRLFNQIAVTGYKFHKVILAGRCFDFEPLTKVFRTRFKELLDNDSSSEIIAAPSKKEICLFGPMSGYKVNYNSGLVGLPTYGTAAKPLLVSPQNSKPNVPKSKIATFFNSMIGKALTFEETQKQDSQLSVDENFFTKGKTLKEYDKGNPDVFISGQRYNFNVSGLPLQDKEMPNFVFTGEKFLLRSNENAVELIPIPLMQNFNEDKIANQLYFATLFPFNHVAHESNIVLNDI